MIEVYLVLVEVKLVYVQWFGHFMKMKPYQLLTKAYNSNKILDIEPEEERK